MAGWRWPGRKGQMCRVRCSFEMSRAPCPLHFCTHVGVWHPDKVPMAVTPRTSLSGCHWHPQNGPWGWPWGPAGGDRDVREEGLLQVLGCGVPGAGPRRGPRRDPCRTAGPVTCSQPGVFACSRWHLGMCFSTPCCPAVWPCAWRRPPEPRRCSRGSRRTMGLAWPGGREVLGRCRWALHVPRPRGPRRLSREGQGAVRTW